MILEKVLFYRFTRNNYLPDVKKDLLKLKTSLVRENGRIITFNKVKLSDSDVFEEIQPLIDNKEVIWLAMEGTQDVPGIMVSAEQEYASETYEIKFEVVCKGKKD